MNDETYPIGPDGARVLVGRKFTNWPLGVSSIPAEGEDQ